jgi:hypothetical protein
MFDGRRLRRLAAGVRRGGSFVAGVAAMPGLHAGWLERDMPIALTWGVVAAVVWGHAWAIGWVIDGFAISGDAQRGLDRRRPGR